MHEQDVRKLFENWFKVQYAWYIRRERRGYSLSTDEHGDYQWDIPNHDYQVFKSALQIAGVISE